MIVCTALVVFTSWFAKLRLEGDTDPKAGLMPFPDSATVVGLVGASLLMVSVADPAPADFGANST